MNDLETMLLRSINSEEIKEIFINNEGDDYNIILPEITIREDHFDHINLFFEGDFRNYLKEDTKLYEHGMEQLHKWQHSEGTANCDEYGGCSACSHSKDCECLIDREIFYDNVPLVDEEYGRNRYLDIVRCRECHTLTVFPNHWNRNQCVKCGAPLEKEDLYTYLNRYLLTKIAGKLIPVKDSQLIGRVHQVCKYLIPDYLRNSCQFSYPNLGCWVSKTNDISRLLFDLEDPVSIVFKIKNFEVPEGYRWILPGDNTLGICYCSCCGHLSFIDTTTNEWVCGHCNTVIPKDQRIDDYWRYKLDDLEPYINEGYRGYLTSGYWRRLRKEALNTLGPRCNRCGSTKNLHVHHKTYKNFLNENINTDFEILCRKCHKEEHKIWKKSKD